MTRVAGEGREGWYFARGRKLVYFGWKKIYVIWKSMPEKKTKENTNSKKTSELSDLNLSTGPML